MNSKLNQSILYGFILTVTGTILLMCAVPPVSRDALIHHLAVPALYIQHQGIYELPDLVFSYYPQLLDLIYCIPLLLKNDILPKYIHFLFALLTSFLIYFHINKRLNKALGLVSMLFFLSLPVIIKLSITVYVDLGLIFFSFSALIFLLKWRKNNFKLKWLVLSAFFCGLALSTKYNGLLTLFLLTAFIPFIYLEKNNQNKTDQYKSLRFAILFLLIAGFVFSPWVIKNYIWTKNPVYPLYNSFFKKPDITQNIKIEKKESFSWNHFMVRKYVYNETWVQTMLIPIRIFFQGEDDNPKYFDGRLNPLLFFLPFLAFLNSKSNKFQPDQFENKILLNFSILYILIVFFQVDMRIRWIGPAIPPLILLSASGLVNLFNTIKFNKLLSALMAILLVSMFSLNFIYAYNLFKKTDPLPFIFSQITRSQYIQKFRPEYAALEFANNNLDKNTKILAFFLGDKRYYSSHDIKFNYSILIKIVKQSTTSLEVLNSFKTYGYTDLIINYPKFNNWVSLQFKEEEKQLINSFFQNHTTKLFSKDRHGLYHLK